MFKKLAGVTISLAINNQGIFNKAKTAGNTYKKAEYNEQTGLNAAETEMNTIIDEYNIAE